MDYHHHAKLTWRGRELLAGVVVQGRLALCEAAAEARQRQLAPPEEIQFTPREWGVLGLLTAGRSNRGIGQALGVTEEAIKAHVGRLMQKVGVTNRISLSVYVLARNVPIAKVGSGRKGNLI